MESAYQDLIPWKKLAGGGYACSHGLFSSLLQGYLCPMPHLSSGLGLNHEGDLGLTLWASGNTQNWIP